MTEKIKKSDRGMAPRAKPGAVRGLEEASHRRPFTGEYVNSKAEGVYACAACGQELFSSSTKFNSFSGWPSFWDVVDEGNVGLREDSSHGMRRVEASAIAAIRTWATSSMSGPRDKTGLRYCINSLALDLKED